jgi:diguanylate cyclase (GGDEF)-like protein
MSSAYEHAPPAPADDLTGLAGRGGFLAALDAALAAFDAERRDPPVLMLLDLDRFKAVNDIMGHPVGDAVLRGAAQRIRGALRRMDLAGRLGGDEFAVLLAPPISDEEAAGIARRLVDLMGRPFLVEGGQLAQIGLSVGVAVAALGLSTIELVKRADLALYAAKARGRGRFAAFEPAMQQAAEERAALSQGLRAALPLGQFRLAYLPLLDIHSSAIEAVEALLRWERPGHGPVGPTRFIPLAEELGLMPAIGAWVLRTACSDAMSWERPLGVNVNVSPTQLADGRLPEIVASVLAETGLPPGRLELEVAEGTLLDAASASPLEQFRALRSLGVHLALDDFGTGYSSLSRLRDLPFRRVKLDRSFAGDPAMMRAAVGVGRALGLSTTAEGIEEPEQLAAARTEGCAQAQGFLISTPLSPEELRGWIANPTPDAR